MSRYNKSDCNVNKRFVAIIAEKPKAAEKIADALGSLGRYNKCNYYRVPYWVVYKNGETILVLPSAGHLFGPSTRGKGVPITKIIWRPTWEFDKSAYYTKPYYQLMSNILPKADMYVNACDYDIEGSVIGYKIIENFGDLNKGMRMKYSTLTKPDIINAFNKLTNIDMDNVNAGSARHELDWLWGINVSRLLMKLFKISAGKSISLSAGRVQSPTLAEAIKRWEEINLYLPIPIFNINIVGEFNEKKFQITTKDWYPENISQAKDVVNYLNNNPILTVSSYQEFKEKIDPPPAFNLGDLQKEASRIYGFSPFKTQGIAEELYLDALISYPRTNSQKLPKTINYKEIIYGLGKQNYYKDLTNSILNETKGYLSPKQGKEEDPAHPAIYPTGEIPKKKLYGDQFKIYDLIVRRFLAAFGKQAVVNRSYAELLDGLKRKYKADGLIILDEGWFKYYTFSYPKANEIPVLKNGDKVYVVNVSLKTIWPKTNTTLSKYSLLRWMEKVNIGTKATRARIIEMLYRRKYLSIKGGKTYVTNLGYSLYKAIEAISSELISPELTRSFEEKLEGISSGKYTRDQVIDEAKSFLVKLIEEKLADKEIGDKLAVSLNIKEPEKRCVICNREASYNLYDTNLCEFHYEAMKKIEKNMSLLMKKIEKSENEVLNELIKNSSTGLWIREASKFLLSKDKH